MNSFFVRFLAQLYKKEPGVIKSSKKGTIEPALTNCEQDETNMVIDPV